MKRKNAEGKSRTKPRKTHGGSDTAHGNGDRNGQRSDEFTRNEDRNGYLKKPTEVEIIKDIDTIFWSLRLHGIRRFFHQRFWEAETKEAEYADRIEPWPRLESVAEHSWHVADTVMLLGPYFARLDQNRCLKLALLHDKLEIITGDANPVGRNGAGTKTHAFDSEKRLKKDMDAATALEYYLSLIREDLVQPQRNLFEEVIAGKTLESCFVRAVDKLQAFAFVMSKKQGDFEDKHVLFTLRYVEKGIEGFPGLRGHFLEMRGRLLKQVATRREKTVRAIESVLRLDQPELPFSG